MTKEKKALEAFISTVEVTGGVRHLGNGCHAPLADEEWLDLGDAYIQACTALKRTPIILDDLCECGRREADCSFDKDDPESEHKDNG